MKILIGSNNPKKMKELQAILGEFGVELVTPKMLGIDLEPEETGDTFEVNSFIKASEFAKASGLPCIADDSGLEILALDCRPGVYSARYGNADSDADRMDIVLKELGDNPDRRARFVSVTTYASPEGKVVSARGECNGEILYEKRGENGFGYDPIFFIPQEGKSFGEMNFEEKSKYSHRSNSLIKLKEKLKPVLEEK